ncbi:helix-turn-helix domain-containing protein [Labrenzia sp. ac12]
MAKPEKEPETELAKRLKLLRKKSDTGDQKSFATALGVSQSALSNYEIGVREPTAAALTAYARVTGVSLDWLLTGEGPMFADPGKMPDQRSLRSIDPVVIGEIGRMILRIYKEEEVRLPPIVLLSEQARSYNALVERAEDPGDTDELLALLPWLEARLRRTLNAAVAEPGTGKHQA